MTLKLIKISNVTNVCEKLPVSKNLYYLYCIQKPARISIFIKIIQNGTPSFRLKQRFTKFRISNILFQNIPWKFRYTVHRCQQRSGLSWFSPWLSLTRRENSVKQNTRQMDGTSNCKQVLPWLEILSIKMNFYFKR